MRSNSKALVVALALLALPAIASAQLSLSWMLPAVAHTEGSQGSYWRSDVSLYNPHDESLPVVLQFLPSDTANWSAVTFDLDLYAWETVNLWDVLGPDVLDQYGTGAMLIYADPALPCTEDYSCDFLVSSRTYTVGPQGGSAEYGQAIPAFTVDQGTDWYSYSYVSGILNDGASFRTNIGASSWSSEWVGVYVDVQDSTGTVINTEYLDIPPFGHVQKRLDTMIEGGTLVFYLAAEGTDPLVYPYASMVNQTTNDPSFFFAQPSGAGLAKSARTIASPTRPTPEVSGQRIVIDRKVRTMKRTARGLTTR